MSLDLLGWVCPPFVSELNLIATLYLRKIHNWKLFALVPLFISRNFRKYGHFGFIPWSACLDLGYKIGSRFNYPHSLPYLCTNSRPLILFLRGN